MDVRGDHDFDGHVDFDDLYTYENGDFDPHVHLIQEFSPGSISKH